MEARRGGSVAPSIYMLKIVCRTDKNESSVYVYCNSSKQVAVKFHSEQGTSDP